MGKQKTVFTNGCFDIVHVGHLRYLTEAATYGQRLVVGLNSDSSVKRLKGDNRPIVSQEERKELLLGLKPVDSVVIFEEDTPLNIILEIKPDVIVKGGDWTPDKIVGGKEVLSWGGEVHSLGFHPGHSTTSIEELILARRS